MQWWNDFVEWFNSDDGSRVISTAIIPFVAIVLAGVIGALIGRSSIKRLVAWQDRELQASAVAAIISVGDRASMWSSLPLGEKEHLDAQMSAADIRLRLLPINGSAAAADWSAHELAEMQRNSASFSFQAEQSFIGYRDRLLEWQRRPGRARKLFAADLERFRSESSAADTELVEQQRQWASDQLAEATREAPATGAVGVVAASAASTPAASTPPVSTPPASTPAISASPVVEPATEMPIIHAPEESAPEPAAPEPAAPESSATESSATEEVAATQQSNFAPPVSEPRSFAPPAATTEPVVQSEAAPVAEPESAPDHEPAHDEEKASSDARLDGYIPEPLDPAIVGDYRSENLAPEPIVAERFAGEAPTFTSEHPVYVVPAPVEEDDGHANNGTTADTAGSDAGTGDSSAEGSGAEELPADDQVDKGPQGAENGHPDSAPATNTDPNETQPYTGPIPTVEDRPYSEDRRW